MDPKELVDVPFTFDVELKAIGTQVVEQLGDGDLLIEGWGATLDVDREDEAFTDNAFTKGLKKFLSGGAPLCWHHKYDQVIGKVVHAERIPGRGVWVKAIVDRQPETSPLYPHYQAIKKGRATGLSVGGIFKRIMTSDGPRINDVDIMEWSATATPVGSTATFSVVAGKALEFKAEDPEAGVTNVEEEVIPVEPVVEAPAPEVETPEVQKPVAEMTEAEKDEVVAKLNQALLDSPELAEKIKDIATLEPGSITTEHLSDELRSRFSELKEETGPTLDDLAASLDRFNDTLNAVAEKVGYEVPVSSGTEASSVS